MNGQELKQARRRLVYEEFLLFQLKMQMLRKIERENSAWDFTRVLFRKGS